ncbi:hypothetical protein [Myxococcus qinghaiensis]|uniref:hypothetical protein n=1 Tax=Myxococcus qinghaiensis TaxID=2906758 RepID=UPI0020A7325F|nr:hypothetical protein [Myxococcus qinghaiensis]MCP3161787.1 hypothetical protein [Myxococcus qinghaiensis]
MKRATLTVLVACAGLTVGCSDTQATTGFAGLSGTYDLTLVGDLVFVTSSDRDELQVLDLAANPKQFISAPNPLQTLAIPVLDRPDSLTHDVGFKADGSELPGPYVYARSAGASQISVVAAARERLVQMQRFTGRSLVTAFAARSPDVRPEGEPPAPSVLYYAIQDPDALLDTDTGGARIERQLVPGPEALEAGEVAPPSVTLFCLQVGESVQAMTVLPGNQLVVATRQASGQAGRTLVVTDTNPTVSADCLTPSAATRDLSAGFDNTPVRFVVSHPRVVLRQDDPSTTTVNEFAEMLAGQFVYGIKDEVACGGAPECTGVLAVDTATGLRAVDLSGAPMFPIRPPDGLPTGLALVPSANLQFIVIGEGGTVVTNAVGSVPLLGVLPSSNGTITMFSAGDRRHFDLDARKAFFTAVARNASEEAIDIGNVATLVDVSQTQSYPCDPANPTGPRTDDQKGLFEGSVPDGIFRFVYQGAFPGMIDLQRDLSTPTTFEVPQAAEASRQVRVGDAIVLASLDILCTTDLIVSSIQPAAEAGKVRLETLTAIPESCSQLPLFTVRALGDQPFLLVDQNGTLLSRDVTGVGSGYEIPTAYSFHPTDFLSTTSLLGCASGALTVPLYPSTPPPVRLRAEPIQSLTRGDRYVVTVGSGVATYVAGVDTSNNSGAALQFYTLPGPVAASQAGGTGLAYIAYPSADGILQVNLELLFPNALNAQALVRLD